MLRIISILFLVLTIWPATAQALPAPKNEGSVCPPGFLVLEDRRTCARLSGRVRADTLFGSSSRRIGGSTGMVTAGRVQLDVRRQTELGPLRAVIRADTWAR